MISLWQWLEVRMLILIFNLICLFMNRHEVHSMNTHTLQNAGSGLIKTDKTERSARH